MSAQWQAHRLAATRNALQYLETYRIPISDLITAILTHPPQMSHPFPFLCTDLTSRAPEIHDALLKHDSARDSTISWAHNVMRDEYSKAVHDLSHNEPRWHFNALNADADQLQEFRIEDMGIQIQSRQPRLWDLILTLLAGTAHTSTSLNDDPDADNQDEDQRVTDEQPQVSRSRGKNWKALKAIKVVTIISILMQSRYSKCNALQGSMGMFLHSCNVAEKVIKVLARTGLSISLASIHNAIHSMSRNCEDEAAELGRSLLVAYAYDNFDVKFNHR